MPAGGDNKPKLEKTINKAIPKLIKADDKCGSLCVALAVIIFMASFIAGCFFAIQPHISFIVLIPDLILFIGSIFYLWHKI